MASPTIPDIAPATSSATKTELSDIVSSVGSSVLDALFIAAGVIAVLYTIWFGIQYVMSEGSPEKMKAARQGLVNGAIGIIVVAASYTIASLGATIGNFISSKI